MSSEFQKVLQPSITYLKPEQINDYGVVGTFIGGEERETKYGPKMLYKIETEGGLVGLNGNGNLNTQLSRVNPGQTVKVEYNGKSVIKTGQYKGQMAHDYEVSVK